MRPMLPADVPLLAEIFRASIEELTGDDYSEAQQEAWAPAADDDEAFGARLAGELTLVATYGGSPVGFAALADNDAHRHALRASGRGRAGRRRHALRRAGKARRRARRQELTVEASDTARGFFERRGFAAQHAQHRVSAAANGSPTPRWSSRSPRLHAAKRERRHETPRRAVPAPLALLYRDPEIRGDRGLRSRLTF